MDIFEAIRERRAVRSFLPRPVGEYALQALLGAAVRAPSAENIQPWSFVLIEDAAFLKRLSEAAKKRLASDPHWKQRLPLSDPDFDIFYGAPVLAVICSRREGFEPVGDCYLAGQNLMLAAYAMGLATCPIGVVRDELRTPAMRRALRIPAEVDPVLPIAVGYAEGAARWTERKSPVIHSWLRERSEPAGRRSARA